MEKIYCIHKNEDTFQKELTKTKTDFSRKHFVTENKQNMFPDLMKSAPVCYLNSLVKRLYNFPLHTYLPLQLCPVTRTSDHLLVKSVIKFFLGNGNVKHRLIAISGDIGFLNEKTQHLNSKPTLVLSADLN